MSEADLLRRIHAPISPEIQTRYDTLRRRSDSRNLSEAEHDELRQITERIEAFDADCLQRLAKLAHLRQKSLRVLIAELGLQPHDYEERVGRPPL